MAHPTALMSAAQIADWYGGDLVTGSQKYTDALDALADLTVAELRAVLRFAPAGCRLRAMAEAEIWRRASRRSAARSARSARAAGAVAVAAGRTERREEI